MRRLFLVTILAALLLAGFGPAAPAQTTETAPAAAETPISGQAAQLDTIAERLAKQDISDFALSEIRNELEAVRGNARKWIEDQTPALNAAQAELDAIGAPPAEGEEPEPPGLVAQREELKRRVGAIAGQVKEAEVVLGRSSRLIADLVEIRRTRFTARILSRGPSPVSPQVWARALPELGVITKSVWNSAKRAVTSPQFEQRLRDSIYVVLGAVALSVLLV